MIEARECVICNGAIRRVRRSLVAPFLAQRIWDRSPFCVDLVKCQVCGFMFYNPRLDAAEETLLYSGYRSQEYQRMRHASEAWYTASFNRDLASAVHYEGRRRTLAAILHLHVRDREIKRILDYGGDRGDLVCGLVDGAAAFVYDISGKVPVSGVSVTTDPAGCKADLIINSNVLEHVGFPRRFLGEIRNAAHSGSLIFLEVPCESPLGFARMTRRIAQIGVVALTRPALLQSVGCLASLYMMHEHINYFTKKSLATLMRSCGCGVMAAGSYILDSRAGKGEIAWCLGSATPGHAVRELCIHYLAHSGKAVSASIML